MTCIVGMIDEDGTVVMGGDSAGVNRSEDLQVRKDPKVFINGQFIIGVCGSWRINQLLRFSTFPVFNPGDDPVRFLAMEFAPALRAILKDEKDDEANKPDFLIGFSGRLFHIYTDLQVSEESNPYEAAGTGARFARGALYALVQANPDWDTRCWVETALEASERFCSGVCGPFTILRLEKGT